MNERGRLLRGNGTVCLGLESGNQVRSWGGALQSPVKSKVHHCTRNQLLLIGRLAVLQLLHWRGHVEMPGGCLYRFGQKLYDVLLHMPNCVEGSEVELKDGLVRELHPQNALRVNLLLFELCELLLCPRLELGTVRESFLEFGQVCPVHHSSRVEIIASCRHLLQGVLEPGYAALVEGPGVQGKGGERLRVNTTGLEQLLSSSDLCSYIRIFLCLLFYVVLGDARSHFCRPKRRLEGIEETGRDWGCVNTESCQRFREKVMGVSQPGYVRSAKFQKFSFFLKPDRQKEDNCVLMSSDAIEEIFVPLSDDSLLRVHRGRKYGVDKFEKSLETVREGLPVRT
mmetsp:Transcript_23779/g.46719  ORF Transcript_23779/g.46719 Transcript_23779/m.46719 type:complete len:340 (+) Transcript_23779:349-1368(+)